MWVVVYVVVSTVGVTAVGRDLFGALVSRCWTRRRAAVHCLAAGWFGAMVAGGALLLGAAGETYLIVAPLLGGSLVGGAWGALSGRRRPTPIADLRSTLRFLLLGACGWGLVQLEVMADGSGSEAASRAVPYFHSVFALWALLMGLITRMSLSDDPISGPAAWFGFYLLTAPFTSYSIVRAAGGTWGGDAHVAAGLFCVFALPVGALNLALSLGPYGTDRALRCLRVAGWIIVAAACLGVALPFALSLSLPVTFGFWFRLGMSLFLAELALPLAATVRLIRLCEGVRRGPGQAKPQRAKRAEEDADS